MKNREDAIVPDHTTWTQCWKGCGGAWPCRMPRKMIGLLLMLLGVLWFASRMEWLDFSWMRMLPWGPVLVIMIGIWVIFRGFAKD